MGMSAAHCQGISESEDWSPSVRLIYFPAEVSLRSVHI